LPHRDTTLWQGIFFENLHVGQNWKEFYVRNVKCQVINQSISYKYSASMYYQYSERYIEELPNDKLSNLSEEFIKEVA
jgi:hypothetical protein